MKAPTVEPTQLIRLHWPLTDEPRPEEWSLLGGGTEPFMLHDATGIVFEIAYDPDSIDPSTRVSVFVLCALVFFADETRPLTLAQVRKLGREAILTFWMLLTDPSARGMDLSKQVTFPEFDAVKEVDHAL